ncbi:uncharacterized protein LOC114579679 [Dendrobium catenatum]|uniref:uncharacterized protein LOC114579679 n=1 Tax=Dendrobium catenatum TaxID=906689 RepID=UPI00109F7173|nr:uncharacterized protein LOC114579679 [Dendrobium catenatum]
MTVDGCRSPVGGPNISGDSDGLLGTKEEQNRLLQHSKMDQVSSRKGVNPLVIREVTDGSAKKVIKFVEGKAINANTPNEVNENSNSVDKLHSVPCSDPFMNPNLQSENRKFSSIDNSTKEGDTGPKTFSGNAWVKPPHIKLNYKMDSTPLSEDGIAILMDSISEKANSQVLRNSLEIKVLGNNIPFPEAVEEILEGGPWYIGGNIIGLDKWSPNFSPETLKGLTAPIWIRLPCLPLHCWDEENICRIASKIGSPIYLDGNSFKWGKREYARVCVRLNLDEKIPKGVWIEGLHGRSFQKVEYERISSLYYHCGKLGHTKNHCSLLIQPSSVTAPEVSKKIVNSAEEIDKDFVQDELGPWIQVKFRKNRQPGSSYLKQKSEFMKTTSIKQKTVTQVYMPVQANQDREEGEIIEPIALEEEVLDNLEEGSKGINNSSNKDASKSLLLQIKNCSTAAVERKYTNTEDKNANIRSIIEADCMEKANSYSEVIKGFANSCISGGLMVCWRKDLATFSILVASPQTIIGELYIANKGKWIIASVYGNNDLYKRKNLWNTLEGISKPVFPIIIGGDFNCILSQKDKLGGKRFKYTQGVQDFNNFISSCDLHELKFIGPRYTWCNNKTGGARIMERLDKCFLNSAALLSIINPVVKHLPRIASDHCPILVNLFNPTIRRKRFIKYEEVWSSYAASTGIVKNSWNKNMVGDPSSRAKTKWLRDGDSNTKFFNAYATGRRSSNWINQIKGSNGKITSDPSEVEDIFVSFFKNKWREKDCYLSGWPKPFNVLNVFDKGVLLKEFKKEELDEVVKHLEAGISPGIDGISYSFIKTFWSIISKDVWKAILSFFELGTMCPNWKENLITLIPKTGNLMLPSSFRPISPCLSVYKLIAKMLLNRMLFIIPKLVSEEQAAFIKGRSSSEHILLAQEVCNKFRFSKAKKGLMAIKIDMEQAYDSMSWSTLTQVLMNLGFPDKFANFLIQCVSNTKFSIIVNGNYSEWIEAKRGFRQGCPLSPFLFILCSQLLTDEVKRNGKELGIKIAPIVENISHLLYADDIVFFLKANGSCVKKEKEILNRYYKCTGQRINIQKSSILFGKSVKRKRKKRLSKILKFKVVQELKYLGINIMQRRSARMDFSHLLNRANEYLNVWGNKYISLAGKILLVKSILSSFPIYYITHSLVLLSLLKELDKMCRDFLWNKQDGSKGLHYISWEVLCKPLDLGGQGIQSLISKVKPLRAKFTWKLISGDSSILYSILAAKYGTLPWNIQLKAQSSPTIKIIISGSQALQDVLRWKVYKGDNINIIQDVWIYDKPILRWPTFIADLGQHIQHLDFFIQEGKWNEQRLKKFFGPDLVDIIKNITIYPDSIQDQPELKFRFSCKSISSLISECFGTNKDEDLTWKWRKKLLLNPRVNILWWRLSLNAIPSYSFLKSRNLSRLIECQRGCNTEENNLHIAVNCQKLNQIFYILRKWGITITVFNSMEDCFVALSLMASNDPFTGNIYCSVVYLNWINRNKVTHGSNEDCSSFIAANAFSMAIASFKNNSVYWETNQLSQLLSHWFPPPTEWVKLNIDAAVKSNYDARIGGVLRDHKGRFLCAFGIKHKHWDSAQMEMKAILSVKDFMLQERYNFKGIIIERDNKNIIDFFNKIYNKQAGFEEELDNLDFSFISEFNQVFFNFVNRNNNKLADYCANYACSLDFFLDSLNCNNVLPRFSLLLKEDCDCGTII